MEENKKITMKKTIILFLTLGIFIACSKDENPSFVSEIAKATIILKDVNGNRVPNIPVYAYEEFNWIVNGEDPFYANYTKVSNVEGEAFFSDINFNETNDSQLTFVFFAHYTLEGINKTKGVSVTFNRGSNKTETLILD